MLPLEQHQEELSENLRRWRAKPLLQEIYAGFYRRLIACIDRQLPGRIVEIGSGIGNLKQSLPDSLATDLFPNPWLDLACDGYELPFRDGALSHIVLFDVLHHLHAPKAFLKEARRVMCPRGRLLILDPYVSACSYFVYGLFHHEPLGSNEPINMTETLPRSRAYYAAQANATRLFFRNEFPGWAAGWEVLRAEPFSSFSYLLSGGYSKPSLYPKRFLPVLRAMDSVLSKWPRLFGARCLIVMTPAVTAPEP